MLPPAEQRPSEAPRPVRILRIIARLNVGGPAHHVTLLSGRLNSGGYQTLLATGSIGRGEAEFSGLSREHGAHVVQLPTLGPEIRPLSDLKALFALMRIIRRYRPDVVHTHTAKAGMVGRLAARLAGGPGVIVVHTFHGHVLEGYFGSARSALYRIVERLLARTTDCLIGVSEATVDDLVRLGVAPRERFRVVPIGLDLERLLTVAESNGEQFRSEVGAAPSDILLGFVGRLVPIKRIDLLLEALARVRASEPRVRLAIVGDGLERPELERRARELALGDAVRFVGFRRDLAAIFAGIDICVLCSDNEGTPVSLIEAGAAGRAVVATDVGGVSEVVTADTGLLVPPGDAGALAEAVARLASDPALRAAMGARARDRVRTRFTGDRLVADVDGLYRCLLRQAPQVAKANQPKPPERPRGRTGLRRSGAKPSD